jgi:hypothetical protein
MKINSKKNKFINSFWDLFMNYRESRNFLFYWLIENNIQLIVLIIPFFYRKVKNLLYKEELIKQRMDKEEKYESERD